MDPYYRQNNNTTSSAAQGAANLSLADVNSAAYVQHTYNPSEPAKPPQPSAAGPYENPLPPLPEKEQSLLQRLIPQPKEDIPVFWSRLALGLLLLEAFILLVLESVVLIYDTITYFDIKNSGSTTDLLDPQLLAGRTYHAAFLASVLFGVFVSWDAILHQNFVQVIAVLGYSLGCFVFSFVQINQTTNTNDALLSGMWPTNLAGNSATQILLAVITGIWMFTFGFLSYKMFGEFGWTIYRVTGGDKKMERAFTNYHIMQILVKFSIFFLFLFAIIILVLAKPNQATEFAVPVIGVPFAIGVGVAGYLGTRRENMLLILLFELGNLAMGAYVIFYFTRIYHLYGDAATKAQLDETYSGIRTPLTFWGVLALILLLGSCLFGFICMNQFGMGLKEVLDQQRKASKKDKPPANIDLDS